MRAALGVAICAASWPKRNATAYSTVAVQGSPPAAAGGSRTFRLPCLTRGATLMINPNDNRCTLYPEEVDALLRTGQIATIRPFTVEEKNAPLVGPPEDPPAWLIDALIPSLAKLPFVQVAYLGGVYSKTEVPEQTDLLIVLGGEQAHTERAVHAVLTAIQPLAATHDELPIDVTYFDSTENIPAWITRIALQPFYERE